MAVAWVKLKITLPNVVIRGGCRTPWISKMKLFIVVALHWKPLTFVSESSILNNLWNDDKICENKLPVLFQYKFIPIYIVLSSFIRWKNPMWFWKKCRHSHRRTMCFLFFLIKKRWLFILDLVKSELVNYICAKGNLSPS